MTETWVNYLDDEDRDAHTMSGYGATMGLGDRPALLIVDVVNAFAGLSPDTVAEDLRRWPDACGKTAWLAIPKIQRLIAEMRDRNLPVIYANVSRSTHPATVGLWRRNESARLVAAEDEDVGEQFVEEISPAKDDLVIWRYAPSAFFGSQLASSLISLQVDSLVICGATTSGCVRATVVDAFSHNYPVIVPSDASFDRIKASHAMALFDMDSRYADVLSTADTCKELKRI